MKSCVCHFNKNNNTNVSYSLYKYIYDNYSVLYIDRDLFTSETQYLKLSCSLLLLYPLKHRRPNPDFIHRKYLMIHHWVIYTLIIYIFNEYIIIRRVWYKG